MTLSINCKDAGDPVCTHTMYGETEEELLKNAKAHGIQEHGYTEELGMKKCLRIKRSSRD
jgi:predicted small metal-binding protein